MDELSSFVEAYYALHPLVEPVTRGAGLAGVTALAYFGTECLIHRVGTYRVLCEEARSGRFCEEEFGKPSLFRAYEQAAEYQKKNL